MNVLVVGSGGREHALAWKLKQSPRVERLFCAPGNPGMGAIAELAAIAPGDTRALLAFARVNKIGLTVIGPELPLANGIAEDFQKAGIRLFGPMKRAAELEWSKVFAKEFMKRHGIPTAAFRAFTASQRVEAAAYLDTCALPVVLKADGLAAGKGVIICATVEEARAALARLTDAGAFGSAGDTIVIEEFLEGEEASVFAVTDGYDAVILAPAQDHKRALDGDRGLNTGGMGAYAPAPVVTPALLEKIRRSIIGPVLRGMESEGRLYRGCLYVGLMITAAGPRVVEFNCRFGDPETQAVLPLYDGDILDLLVAACDGTIARLPEPAPPSGAAACVVMTSAGYPESYETGKRIDGLDTLSGLADIVVFHAGTSRDEHGALLTAGGRVLGVTAFSREGGIPSVVEAAYTAVGKISFEGMHFRRDIGWRALAPRPAQSDET
jgi:phosphoribosylamine--glycine ligase